MIKITLTDALTTEYNEDTEDWSGREGSVYGEPLTGTGATIAEALHELLETYFGGVGLESMQELLNNLKENAEYDTSVISYTGDEFGNYDMAGRYLVDLFIKVYKVESVDIETLIAE